MKCEVYLQCKSVNNACSLALPILHAMERRETTLLSNAAFLAAFVLIQGIRYFQNIFKNSSASPFGSIVEALANVAGVI